jgi:hypothetical protein
MTAELMTDPPVVGNAMALAGIAMPTRAAHDVGVCAIAMGAAPASSMSATNRRQTNGLPPEHAGNSFRLLKNNFSPRALARGLCDAAIPQPLGCTRHVHRFRTG